MESASQTHQIPRQIPFPIVPDEDLDLLIFNNTRYIRFYFSFAVGVVAAGIILIVLIYTVFGASLPDALKSLFGIGCGFISSLSSFQIKELLSRREQQAYFLSIKTFRRESNPSSSAEYEVWKRKEDILWNILEKKASG